MPGTTPSGAPYPLPSEPVRDGAVAIRNLAEWLDPRAPYKVLPINGNYALDAQGYFSITVPGTGIVAGMLHYFGTFGPIIVNGFNAGGAGMGFKVYNVTTGAPVTNTTVQLMGEIVYN